MPKKLTYNYVKEQFEKENYTLVSDEYINSGSKLSYICSNGHEREITYNNWRTGKRCYYCHGTVKKTIEEVRQKFEEVGYTLLSTEYINARTKLTYICTKGHEHSINWSDWFQGVRCPSCSNNNIKLTIEFIKTEFEKDGYTVLSNTYKDAHSKINFICPKGHRHSIRWASWQQGVRCGRCKGNIEIKYDDVKKSFIDAGYTLLSNEYINSTTKLYYICSKNHKCSTTWSIWNCGFRCTKCTNVGTSNFEKEVKQFIIDQGQDIIENDRTTIKGTKGKFLELDILFPCKTKAIECNGVYWHDRPEIIEKDKLKKDQCKELGINLLTITDEVWYNNCEECEKIIKDFI